MEHFQICPVTNYYQMILLPASYGLEFKRCPAVVPVLWDAPLERHRHLHVQPRRGGSPLSAGLAPSHYQWCHGRPVALRQHHLQNRQILLFFVNLHCGMTLLACFSVHRFLGVCFPIAAMRLRTKKLALFGSGFVWFLTTAGILPTLFFADTGVINNITVCFEMTSPRQFKVYFPYGLFSAIVGFLIPFLVVITCYCSMVKMLHCRAAHSISNARAARVRNKSLSSLLAVSLMFVVCFVPYHVARTVYLFVRVYMPRDCELVKAVMISYTVWKPVVSFNCCVNPLLYFWGSRRRRDRKSVV